MKILANTAAGAALLAIAAVVFGTWIDLIKFF